MSLTLNEDTVLVDEVDILNSIQQVLEYGIVNCTKDTYEVVVLEAVNTAYQQIYNRVLKQLSIPLTPVGNQKLPEAAVAAVPTILGYHNRTGSRLEREIRTETSRFGYKYGPVVANLAASVKQSNNAFVQRVSEITQHFGDIQLTGLRRYDALLNRAANDPKPLLDQRLINVPNTYGILAGSRTLRTYALNSLSNQQEQVLQLTKTQTAEQITQETLSIVKELETAIKTEQALRNIAGKILNLVWFVVRGILSVLWRILRPLLSVLWRLLGPALPILEKLTAAAVKVTAPLRGSYALLNSIPGFTYLRFGLLVGLPLAGSLIPGLGPVAAIADTFKTSMTALLQGSTDVIDDSIKEFVQAHSGGILAAVLGTISPALAQIVDFVLGTWLPFLFGFGVNNFILILVILLLPLIHKGIVFLRHIENMRKELANIIVEDMEQEKKRVQRSVAIRGV